MVCCVECRTYERGSVSEKNPILHASSGFFEREIRDDVKDVRTGSGKSCRS